MAFLDNSGDIILDAVLTDLGRKRMAEGNFRITQFALGDDEIDYSLYDATHPSGSAYYDLEILQTPVFEAFTQTNANINYGLLSLRDDLLYIPSLVHNQTVSTAGKKLYNNVLLLAANEDTGTALAEATGIIADRQILRANRSSTQYVLFETGINNNGNPLGTNSEKTTYITNQRLNDNDFSARVDSRFIGGLYGINSNSKFEYELDDAIDIRITNSVINPNAAGDIILPSIDNAVYDIERDGTNAAPLNYSAINGPRARAFAFNISLADGLSSKSLTDTPAKYSLFGKTGQTLYGISSTTFDFIDTVVYLNGNSTGANTQLISKR
ncbi:MAG: hypothetical protein ACXADH_18770 [Candidatus Kariarchaeaceae archaeon]|jgi:hypothetical protein